MSEGAVAFSGGTEQGLIYRSQIFVSIELLFSAYYNNYSFSFFNASCFLVIRPTLVVVLPHVA